MVNHCIRTGKIIDFMKMLFTGWKECVMRKIKSRSLFLSENVFLCVIHKKKHNVVKFSNSKYKLWSRCIDRWQTFPPGRSIWCNNSTKGPTARPASRIGGHLCCADENYCNSRLKPIIYDFSKHPHRIFEGGDERFEYFLFLSASAV